MVRGVWLCQRNGVKKHGTPSERPSGAGCNRWNVYISSDACNARRSNALNARESKGGQQVDLRCKVCNKRAKFYLNVVPDQYRGRPRVVEYQARPDSMPYYALLEEVRSRNRYNSQGEEIHALEEGFVKASLMSSSPPKVVVPGVRPEAKPFSRA